jgi:choice-of-anchor A domain-containing protein
MIKRYFVSAAVSIIASLAMPAMAAPATDPAHASAYNVFARHDVTVGVDIQGRVAAGNDITLKSGGSIGIDGSSATQGAVVPGEYTAVAGHNINYPYGGVGNIWGDSLAAGYTTPSFPVSTNTGGGRLDTGLAGSVVDISAEFVRLSALSNGLASTIAQTGYGSVGTVAVGTGFGLGGNAGNPGDLYFYATDPNAAVNIFNITADQLKLGANIHLAISEGSVAVINVIGADGGNFALNSITGDTLGSLNLGYILEAVNQAPYGYSLNNSENILWNFNGANSLNFSGSFYGSVLATDAVVTLNGGTLYGQVIADSVNAKTQVNWSPFNGWDRLDQNSGAVPEPASWAMMIAGFGLVGTAMRRRNKLAASFA